MLYIPKIGDHLKVLTDEEVKDFVAISLSEYFKCTREEWYSKLSKEENLRQVATSLYIFLKTLDKVEKYTKMMKSNSFDNCVHRYNVEILNHFDPDLQLINTKPVIKDKLKGLLKELKSLKFRQY